MSEISNRIIKGKYSPGEKLPSVRDLAAEAAVNPNTMQRALAALESSGLIYTERTSGRFVTEDESLIEKAKLELAKGNINKFFSGMAELGFTNDESIAMASEMKEVN